ncbi:hypothetical protein M758_4G183200 [Ceratodon purpureus]|nr:hypothetical protein M758_4G183200 [Ceratodon purpureus]
MDFQWSRNGPMFQEPRWISCYSNQHLILLVGEGNFSFSASLGNAFGAATNMVATSLDSKDELLKKYGRTAEWNTISLMHRGALVFHGFDACKMAVQQKYLLSGFHLSLFHYIIFNFPHAGFLGKESDARVLKKHRELVRDFFANAKEMLLPGGQVHVRHKLGQPYDEWKLEELALSTGLKLVGRVRFQLHEFPGYQSCRGDGFRADESFKLGPADTYIFTARDEEPPAKIS